MSKYTIELRKIINSDISIFPTEYELYNNDFKSVFENKFIKRFYFREIGCETIERFKFYLTQTLEEIMPYYTHLYKTTSYIYDPILNYDVKEEITRSLLEENKSSLVGNIINNNKQYDTPITKNSSYKLSPSFIVESDGTENKQGLGENKQDEKHIRRTSGNIGVMTTQDLIMKERQIIINIDKMIFDELEILFMQVF